jgi:hypothetical protein
VAWAVIGLDCGLRSAQLEREGTMLDFDMGIDLLQEFRRTGRGEAFNSLHAAARKLVAVK